MTFVAALGTRPGLRRGSAGVLRSWGSSPRARGVARELWGGEGTLSLGLPGVETLDSPQTLPGAR